MIVIISNSSNSGSIFNSTIIFKYFDMFTEYPVNFILGTKGRDWFAWIKRRSWISW